jgi:CHAD domain-containing protein
LVTDPPWTFRARRTAEPELRRLVRRTVSRVEAAHRAAADAEWATGRAERLHQVRKDAKRARYAFEAVTPVLGRRARDLAKRWEAVQESLGEHQDSVVARALLRDLGVRAHLAGENGFTYGRLHGLEDARAVQALDAYAHAWAAAARGSARRWLR